MPRARSPRAVALPPTAAALLAAAALALAGCPTDPAPRGPEGGRLSLTELLAAEPEAGFARALEPRPFVFPADHGPHPEFRTEWWYFTGNLEAAGGRAFGYQLTFFRNALAAAPPPRSSRWATRDAWMAHFALTDAAGRRFHSFERFSRPALGLAGARAEPFAVWLEDWRVEATGGPIPPLRLTARADGIEIELQLDTSEPPLLQGDRGLSRKGLSPGNASYYYSFTRLASRGTIDLGGRRLAVVGASWLDREWSTSALEPGQEGWDWFALQLSGDRELMVYRLRGADGETHPSSAGVLVDPDGPPRPLDPESFELVALSSWRSPASGVRYPSSWRLEVPSEAISLLVTPLLPDQELRHSVLYWEGAVRVEGSAAGSPVTGRGYVELTGYPPASAE